MKSAPRLVRQSSGPTHLSVDGALLCSPRVVVFALASQRLKRGWIELQSRAKLTCENCRQRVGLKKNPEGLLPWEHFMGPPSYKAAHGGMASKEERMRSVPDPKDNRKLITEGVLTRVEYRANKGDGVKTYYHDFRGHKPLLCYGSDDGRLYVVEGSYKVTARGIVG